MLYSPEDRVSNIQFDPTWHNTQVFCTAEQRSYEVVKDRTGTQTKIINVKGVVLMRVLRLAGLIFFILVLGKRIPTFPLFKILFVF